MEIKKSYESLIQTEQAPHLKYDMEEVRPDVIQQKKWDLVYKIIAFSLIVFVFLISYFIESIKEINQKIWVEKVQISDLEPIVKKMKIVTNNTSQNTININKFLLENLFFVWDKNYEITNKLKLFFEDPKVMANLWDFKVTEILLSNEVPSWLKDEEPTVKKIPIKIKGSFTNYKDLETAMWFMGKMSPVVVVENVSINQQNTVDLTWFIFTIKKWILDYEYDESYNQINEVLRLKEDFDKNKQLLTKILEDADLWLKSFWINKIYDCQQYSDLLEKQGIEKTEEVETCKALEKLVNKQEEELDTKFNIILSSQ